MEVLTNPAFVAFFAFIVLVFSVYKSKASKGDLWSSILFHFVLQFIIGAPVVMLIAYFSNVFIGTKLLTYSQSLLIASAVLGFMYLMKTYKYII
ncbi:MAG: hypothetical protein QXV17_04960 [Candidatus Micrarchaeaceae archaeon]